MLVLTGLLLTTGHSEQALTRDPGLMSPDIYDDHSVIFRLKAPTATTATIFRKLDALLISLIDTSVGKQQAETARQVLANVLGACQPNK